MRYAIDPMEINKSGWLPEKKFAYGIEKTINWDLDNREW